MCLSSTLIRPLTEHVLTCGFVTSTPVQPAWKAPTTAWLVTAEGKNHNAVCGWPSLWLASLSVDDSRRWFYERHPQRPQVWLLLCCSGFHLLSVLNRKLQLAASTEWWHVEEPALGEIPQTVSDQECSCESLALCWLGEVSSDILTWFMNLNQFTAGMWIVSDVLMVEVRSTFGLSTWKTAS